MKLAEALALRSDVQKRLAQVQERLRAAARYQEGEEPAESAANLLAEAKAHITQLESLVRQVNKTNSAYMVTETMTISDAIAKRDALGLRHKLLTEAADAASGRDRMSWHRRTARSELRDVAALDVTALRREADELAHIRRKLDLDIQAANWATDLLE